MAQRLFQIKLLGTFTRDSFIASEHGKVLTVTKFSDGTWCAKVGHKTVKDRFSTGGGVIIRNCLCSQFGLCL